MYVIIGASGFIGSHLYEYCRKNEIDVVGTYHKHSCCSEFIPFDLCTDDFQNTFHQYLREGGSHAVIICGANSSIDSCKRDEEASCALNVTGTKKLLDQAEEMGIKSVFLSSEAVFDGKRGMYTEEDRLNPITVYGKQKMQIEQYMIQSIKNYLIFRISRAVGSSYGEKDIFNEFLLKITRNEEIVCLKDQSFCLTEINDIAKGIIGALEQGLIGLYHLSSANYISRYELANIYAQKIFGYYDKIIEKEYADIPFWDNRHIFGGLNGNKLAGILGIHYMDIDSILNKYSRTYNGRKGVYND